MYSKLGKVMLMAMLAQETDLLEEDIRKHGVYLTTATSEMVCRGKYKIIHEGEDIMVTYPVRRRA